MLCKIFTLVPAGQSQAAWIPGRAETQPACLLGERSGDTGEGTQHKESFRWGCIGAKCGLARACVAVRGSRLELALLQRGKRPAGGGWRAVAPGGPNLVVAGPHRPGRGGGAGGAPSGECGAGRGRARPAAAAGAAVRSEGAGGERSERRGEAGGREGRHGHQQLPGHLRHARDTLPADAVLPLRADLCDGPPHTAQSLPHASAGARDLFACMRATSKCVYLLKDAQLGGAWRLHGCSARHS
mmetsp:Transcript_29062/g.74533  ORF Transcript_29062/g.74533 Transcript_29062/m.74533 type:complete len:242 (+) Transcript_29062:242-967(+)